MSASKVVVEGSSLIPKNPWVAAALLGGIAIVVYVVFEELQKTLKSGADTLATAPGQFISNTVSAVTDSASKVLKAPIDITQSAFQTLVSDWQKVIGTPAPTTPDSTGSASAISTAALGPITGTN